MAKGLKIWKTIMLASLLCLLLALGGGMLACNPGESHTHSWSETYSYDDDNHWLSCSGCDQRTGTEAHVFDNDQDTTCNVCGYTRHVHTLVWKNDGDINGKHWQEYSCEHHSDERLNEGDHVWGNDNICDVCLLDKTPPHVHHEITRYDETQHWTTYDCTEHGNEKINPQSHTFTNGSKCDGCDFDRDAEHQHSLSGWIHNNDPQYHWKEYTCWHHTNEQVDKAPHNFNGDDECDDCGYVRTHEHNNYLVWTFDESNHWKIYNCEHHADERIDEAAHDFGTGGVCECGLAESYLQVYDVYKAFEQAKGGSEISGFTEWYASLKEQNVHHVGVNGNGDAVYYSSAEDTTGAVKYYALRTYTVNISVDGVWVAAKVNDGGQKKVLSLAQSSNGSAQLSFIPLWEDAAGYEICIATVDDLTAADKTPLPMPVNCIVVDGNSSITINPRTTTPEDLTINVAFAIGLGNAGALEGEIFASYGTTFRTYYFNDSESWGAGIYQLTFDMTYITPGDDGHWTADGIEIKFGESDTERKFSSNGPESACVVFKLDGAEKFFMIKWGGKGELTGKFTLTKLSTDITAENINELVYPIYESTNCDISGLAAGKYVMVASSADLSNLRYAIDSESNTSLTSEQLIEIKEGAKSLKITSGSSGARYVSTCNIRFVKLNSYTLQDEGDDYNITEKEGFVTFDKGLYFVALNIPEEDMYRVTLSAGSEFTSFRLSLRQNSSNSVILSSDKDKAKNHTALFNGKAGDYYLRLETTESEAGYPRDFTLKIDVMHAESFEVNEEITTTFSEDNMSYSYIGQIEAGTYILYSKTDPTGKNVKFTVTVDGTKKVNKQSMRFNTFNITEAGEANITVAFSGSENYPTIKFVLIRIDDGTDITSSKDNFTASFTDTEYYKIFTFTESEANYYRFKMQSESDLRNVTIYYVNYGKNTSAFPLFNALGVETKSYEYNVSSDTTSGAKFTIIVFANNDSDIPYPTAINMSMKPRLNMSGSASAGTNVPYVEFYLDAFNHATSYEVYLATNEQSNQTIEDGQYELVHTYTSWTVGEKLMYVNYDMSKYGNYFYWKIVAKDSTGKYLEDTTTTTSSKAYSKNGGTTKVTVNHPDDFEGTIILKLSTNQSTSAGGSLFGYKEQKAEKGTTQTEISVFTADKTAGDTIYVYTSVTGTGADHYTMPSTYKGSVGTDCAVTIEKRVKISVTVNLPDNFQPKANEPIEVTFYKGTTGTTTAGSCNLSVVEGNKATGEVWLDKYTQGFMASITKGLDTGYAASVKKTKVTVNGDGETGSVTFTVNQRTQVDIELTVPAHFAGGVYTVEFYLYNDETPATSATATFNLTLNANDTEETAKQTLTAYLPMGGAYLVKIKSPANSGYTVSEIEKIELDETTKKASATVNDRVTVTANVELPGTSKAKSVTIELYEKDPEKLISTATVSVTLDGVSGKLKGSGEIYGPEGLEYVLKVKSSSSDDFEFLEEKFDVTVDGKTGSCSIVGTLKYSVTVTFQFKDTTEANKYTNTKFGNVYLHKDGVQIQNKSASLSNKKCTVTFLISADEFDSSAQYVISVVNSTSTLMKYNFLVPSFRVEWSEEHVQLDITREIVYAEASNFKPIEYTIDIPKEYTSEETHTLFIAEPYGVWNQNAGTWTTGTEGVSKISIPFTEAQAKDDGNGRTYKGTWTNYPKCENLNFILTGGDLTNMKSTSGQNAITKWYAVSSPVTYDEQDTGHVTITFKQNTPVKISIPNLVSDGTPTTSFTLSIILNDGSTKIGEYRFTIDRNATNETLNKEIYVLEWKDTYKATVTISADGNLGCTYKLAEAEPECKTTDETHIIQINVEQLKKVKVSIPGLGSDASAAQFTLTLEVKDGGSRVGIYRVTVPENATSDFLEYLWLPEWKDTYTITATSDSDAYTIGSEATNKTTEGVYEIEVTATKKDA